MLTVTLNLNIKNEIQGLKTHHMWIWFFLFRHSLRFMCFRMCRFQMCHYIFDKFLILPSPVTNSHKVHHTLELKN